MPLQSWDVRPYSLKYNYHYKALRKQNYCKLCIHYTQGEGSSYTKNLDETFVCWVMVGHPTICHIVND